MMKGYSSNNWKETTTMGLTSATIEISYQTSMSISGVMLDIKGRRNWMHYTPLNSIPVLEGMDQNFKIIQVTHHHTLHITTSRSSDDFLYQKPR